LELNSINEIKNDDVKAILAFILTELYNLTLNSNFGLYFASAYTLSIHGGEYIRLKNEKYFPLSIKNKFTPINYFNVNVVAEKINDEVKDEENKLEETYDENNLEESATEDIIDTDNSGDFIPSDEIDYSNEIKKNEMILRIQKNFKNEKELQKDTKFLCI
jgi:hypothetical protein